MLGRGTRFVTTAGVLLATASAAAACPLCGSDTGEQVRAGIFGGDFAATLLAVLLPFPVLAAVVIVIHRGPPRVRPTGATS